MEDADSIYQFLASVVALIAGSMEEDIPELYQALVSIFNNKHPFFTKRPVRQRVNDAFTLDRIGMATNLWMQLTTFGKTKASIIWLREWLQNSENYLFIKSMPFLKCCHA